MNPSIALCADSECLRNPIELGLKGERILDQTWIVAFADAMVARQYLRQHRVDETWVVSSDSVDGINLAAALKKDNELNQVRLFLSSPSGSNMSRCQNANIIPICGKGEFAHLYEMRKRSSTRNSKVSTLNESMASSEQGFSDPADYFGTLEASVPVGSAVGGAASIHIPNSRVQVQRIERKVQSETPSNTSLQSIPDIEEAPSIAPALAPLPDSPQQQSFKASCHITDGNTAIRDLADKRSRTASAVEEGASIVSIVSGSGGTGKSSVSALVALHAQNKGYRTLILDADFQFGDLQYLMGYKHPLDTSDILAHPEQIETLLKVDTWPALLSAPSQLEHSELMVEKIGELLAYLKPHFDLIVVNTGAFWSDLQVQLLEASNHVFFLLDQRPSSIRACNHALDLCARCGVATTSFSYLLNFCSKKSLLSALDVSCALKGAKVHEIKDGGAEVGELLGAGMAHKLSKLNNPFCASIDNLLKKTIYERTRPSLTPTNEPVVATVEKFGPTNVKAKLRARQKRRAACF